MGRPALLGRAPKQCRSRYLQQLVPGIKTGEWSPEEEEVLVDGHRQFGNQWTLIASMLPGRTETSVKNHYNCTARRCGAVVGAAELLHAAVASIVRDWSMQLLSLNKQVVASDLGSSTSTAAHMLLHMDM